MTDFDAIVVGGGVLGAVTALELVRRGLRPVVLERGHPGGGATSASFGIVHGGLRYLQSLDLLRARRSRRAQRWWSAMLPARIRSVDCTMPLYRRTLRSPHVFRAAFLLDRAISHGASSPGARILRPEQVCLQVPLVREGLVAGASWPELLLVDPQGAVRDLLALVVQRGGTVLAHTAASGPIVEADRVAGVRGKRQGDGMEVELRAPFTLLCAGAQSRTVARRMARDDPRLSCAALAFNLRIDVPASMDGVVAVSPDTGRGRCLFLREDRGSLLAGTWYAGWRDGESPVVGAELIESALVELRRCLPQLPLSRHSIIEVMAGLLPDQDGTGRKLRTRDVHVDHGRHGGPQGIHSLLGTKLTTAHALAERVTRSILGPATAAGADRGFAARADPDPRGH